MKKLFITITLITILSLSLVAAVPSFNIFKAKQQATTNIQQDVNCNEQVVQNRALLLLIAQHLGIPTQEVQAITGNAVGTTGYIIGQTKRAKANPKMKKTMADNSKAALNKRYVQDLSRGDGQGQAFQAQQEDLSIIPHYTDQQQDFSCLAGDQLTQDGIPCNVQTAQNSPTATNSHFTGNVIRRPVRAERRPRVSAGCTEFEGGSLTPGPTELKPFIPGRTRDASHLRVDICTGAEVEDAGVPGAREQLREYYCKTANQKDFEHINCLEAYGTWCQPGSMGAHCAPQNN